MKRAYFLPILLFALVILVAWPSREEIEHPRPEYVGAARCKVCHTEVFDLWNVTGHASALLALKGGERQDSACLACHTTGYGDRGYGSREALVDLGGVQCEACHGAGSLYSRSSVMRQPELSRELGLADVDSTTCTRCHNEKQSPAFKGFAYKAGLLTGTHQRGPVRESTTTPATP
jgi:hypothetical protein